MTAVGAGIKNRPEQFLTSRSASLKNDCGGGRHKKLSGTVFNVAQRRPEGWLPWMADIKKPACGRRSFCSQVFVFFRKA